jgi:uncharacterized protein
MVFNDTIEVIKKLYGSDLADILIDRLILGLYFTGVKLSNGCAGIVYTPAAELHGYGEDRSNSPDKSSYMRFKGENVAVVLNHSSDSLLHRTVSLAVMNALSAPFLVPERYKVQFDQDVLDLINLEDIGRVGMVGAIFPFVRRFKEIHDINLSVIERKEENLASDEKKYFVAAERAPEVLSLCDTVIITGAAIANGTIDNLLKWIKHRALVVVTGPTASMVPDALFNKNVTIVSGISVTDADMAMDMLAEGATAYHLFKTCVRKINIVRK